MEGSFFRLKPTRYLSPWISLTLCLLLLQSGYCIRLESATYDTQTAHFTGNSYSFAIFEAQYDEVSTDVVSEEGYNIKLLPHNTWLNETINNEYDSAYYKFELVPNVSIACPIITLEVETDLGALSLFVSTTSIPSYIDHTWYKPYYGTSSYSICPSNPNMVYGTYYMALVNQLGSRFNRFKLKWTVQNSPSCKVAFTPSPDPVVPDELYSNWLIDGTLVNSTIPAVVYTYYKLFVDQKCSTISAAVYSWDVSADFDIVASSTNQFPTTEDKHSYSWHGTIDGDDMVNFNYCTEADNFTIYFAVRTLTPGGGEFNFLATTQQYTPNYPISQLSYTQSMNELSYGAFPFLNCSDRVYSCGFPTYTACDQDDFQCCYLFSPLPVSNLAQALWPWQEWDETIGNLATNIPWSDTEPGVSGKLAWKLRLETKQTSNTAVYSYADPSSCVVTLSSNIVDSQGTPITGSISFTEKPKFCDYTAFKASEEKISSLTKSMFGQVDITGLSLQQLRLNLASFEPSIIGCQAFIQNLSIVKDIQTPVNTTACLKLEGTISWKNDACCNPELALTQCCRSTEAILNESRIQSSHEEKVSNTCRNVGCVTKSLDSYGAILAAIGDEIVGCSTIFSEQSSLSRLIELTDFLDSCRLSIVGEDLNGAPCVNDSGCLYSGTCNLTTRRCIQTDSDVIQCLSEFMDPTTGRILLNNWGIKSRFSPEVMAPELEKRIKTAQCVGPTALQHRQAYQYATLNSECEDTCKIEGREPICFDRTSHSCVTADDCQASITDGVCYRYWKPLENDYTGCLSDMHCNWMSCYGIDDCQASCLNNTLPEDVCLVCADQSQCTEIAGITNSTRCNQGLCTTGINITNEADCKLSGICSFECASCDTKQGCEAAGRCSDAELIQTIIGDTNRTAVCLYPIIYTANDGGYCLVETDVMLPNGCANLTAKTLAECSTTWYTFATTEEECVLSRSCKNLQTETWLPMDRSECLDCSEKLAWESHFSWEIGAWTSGEHYPLIWTKRSYSRANHLESTIDYTVLQNAVESAITAQFATSYATDSLCRYQSSLQLVDTVACDCVTDIDARTCFGNTVQYQIGEGNGCPLLQSTIKSLTADIEITEESFPVESGCQRIKFYATPSSQYKIDSTQTVSQALFRDSETNNYWVVKNSEKAYIGQIVSAGILVNWGVTLEAPIGLCVSIDTSIEVASVATEGIMAYLDDDDIVRPLSKTARLSLVSGVKKICANINESGTYFAAYAVTNYDTQDNRASVIQYPVGAALYLCVVVFGVIQAILLAKDHEHQRIIGLKVTFISIIFVNCVIRALYVLLPANAFGKGMDSIQFIVFELPSFLYFSVFTVIMYMWLLVVLKTYYFGKRMAVAKKEMMMRKGFTIANCAMYMIFVVFIFLIAILPGRQTISPCFFGNVDTSNNTITYKIKLAYWIFQAVVAFLVSVGFITGGMMLTTLIFKMRKTQLISNKVAEKQRKSDTQIIIITIVSFVCIIFIIIRSALFLWAAIESRSLNIIVFVLLEIVPQSMVLFYVHPFSCFREVGRKSSSYSGTSSTKSHVLSPRSTISSHS